jgi:hypothetical protein
MSLGDKLCIASTPTNKDALFFIKNSLSLEYSLKQQFALNKEDLELLWSLQNSHEFVDDHWYRTCFPFKIFKSITIHARTIHWNIIFIFINTHVIRLTIKRTEKWHMCYWLFMRNKYMLTDKQPNIGNMYVRLGNHIAIATKGKFGSNIRHIHGRCPTTI